MSAVSEAQELIGKASDSADVAGLEIEKVMAAMTEAVQRLNSAAGDTGHAKVALAMEAYLGAAEKLDEVKALVIQAQEAADEYSAGLG